MMLSYEIFFFHYAGVGGETEPDRPIDYAGFSTWLFRGIDYSRKLQEESCSGSHLGVWKIT